MISQDEGASPLSPPELDDYLVKMACERPDPCGRSLSQGDCQQIADQLVREGRVAGIGRESVRLRLKRNRLKPWRYKMWLSSKVPRDAAFVARVTAIQELYTRPLANDEIVLCLDENTNLQPRPRLSPTLAAGIDQPIRLEHDPHDSWRAGQCPDAHGKEGPGMAVAASAFCLASPSGSLLVAKPDRAMVWHFEASASAHRGLCGQSRAVGAYPELYGAVE